MVCLKCISENLLIKITFDIVSAMLEEGQGLVKQVKSCVLLTSLKISIKETISQLDFGDTLWQDSNYAEILSHFIHSITEFQGGLTSRRFYGCNVK